MEDKGSHSRYVQVSVLGVLLQGVVDTGSDLTITGKETFKKVATVFHPTKKKAYSYDWKPFTLKPPSERLSQEDVSAPLTRWQGGF